MITLEDIVVKMPDEKERPLGASFAVWLYEEAELLVRGEEFDQIEREGIDRVAARPARPETVIRRGLPLSPSYAKLAAKRCRQQLEIANRRKDNPPVPYSCRPVRVRSKGRISQAMRATG